VRVARLDEAAEAVLGEDAGVLGVEAEDEPDAEPVQRSEGVGRDATCCVRVFGRSELRPSRIAFQQRVVELADDAAGLDGDLQLAVDGLLLRVDEEREAVRLLREVAEADDERRRERPGAVVDLEAVEVAGDNPAGLLVERTGVVVFAGLLVGREPAVAGLRCGEVDAAGLVLNEDACLRDPGVEELRRLRGRSKLRPSHRHGHLVADAARHVRDAEHLAEQVVPELLVFAFLAAAPVSPALDERLRRAPPSLVCHRHAVIIANPEAFVPDAWRRVLAPAMKSKAT